VVNAQEQRGGQNNHSKQVGEAQVDRARHPEVKHESSTSKA
jgi:hypothetical protein